MLNDTKHILLIKREDHPGIILGLGFDLRDLVQRGLSSENGLVGSLSKRTFQGDAVMKSEKARDSRRRSRAKFNLLSTGATRLRVLHSQILACLILLGLLWYVLTSFVRFFFSYYNASLISDEDYIILYELLSSRIQILVRKAIVSTWMK